MKIKKTLKSDEERVGESKNRRVSLSDCLSPVVCLALIIFFFFFVIFIFIPLEMLSAFDEEDYDG